MKTNQTSWLSAVTLLGVTVCLWAVDKPMQGPESRPPGSHDLYNPASTNKAASREAFPVIGYLEKRDRTITIKAGPKGPLYTVKTSTGKILFENVPAEQLRAQAPELGEFLKTAVAGSSGARTDARLRVTVDARMR